MIILDCLSAEWRNPPAVAGKAMVRGTWSELWRRCFKQVHLSVPLDGLLPDQLPWSARTLTVCFPDAQDTISHSHPQISDFSLEYWGSRLLRNAADLLDSTISRLTAFLDFITFLVSHSEGYESTILLWIQLWWPKADAAGWWWIIRTCSWGVMQLHSHSQHLAHW